MISLRASFTKIKSRIREFKKNNDEILKDFANCFFYEKPRQIDHNLN